MTTARGPRQSTPDSATPPRKRGTLARLGTYKRAVHAARFLFTRALPPAPTLDDELDTARWLVTYAECLEGAARAIRAEVVRKLYADAGTWRKLEARVGVDESTLRGWAAHERG